jgi:hypothetical protein
MLADHPLIPTFLSIRLPLSQHRLLAFKTSPLALGFNAKGSASDVSQLVADVVPTSSYDTPGGAVSVEPALVDLTAGAAAMPSNLTLRSALVDAAIAQLVAAGKANVGQLGWLDLPLNLLKYAGLSATNRGLTLAERATILAVLQVRRRFFFSSPLCKPSSFIKK